MQVQNAYHAYFSAILSVFRLQLLSCGGIKSVIAANKKQSVLQYFLRRRSFCGRRINAFFFGIFIKLNRSLQAVQARILVPCIHIRKTHGKALIGSNLCISIGQIEIS